MTDDGGSVVSAPSFLQQLPDLAHDLIGSFLDPWSIFCTSMCSGWARQMYLRQITRLVLVDVRPRKGKAEQIAEKALRSLFARLTKLRVLEMDNTAPVLDVLVSALGDGLRDVRIDKLRLGTPRDDEVTLSPLPEAMLQGKLPHLQELELRGNGTFGELDRLCFALGMGACPLLQKLDLGRATLTGDMLTLLRMAIESRGRAERGPACAPITSLKIGERWGDEDEDFDLEYHLTALEALMGALGETGAMQEVHVPYVRVDESTDGMLGLLLDRGRSLRRLSFYTDELGEYARGRLCDAILQDHAWSNLEELETDMRDGDITELLLVLVDSVDRFRHLHTLKLTNSTRSYVRLALFLAHGCLPGLRTLELDSCTVRNVWVEILDDELNIAPPDGLASLTSLTLRSPQIDADVDMHAAGEVLARLMTRMRGLNVLAVERPQVAVGGEDGGEGEAGGDMVCITRALEDGACRGLTKLNVSGTLTTPAGVVLLCNALQSSACPVLEKLYIEGLKGDESAQEGPKALAGILRDRRGPAPCASTLTKLQYISCGVNDAGVRVIAQAISQPHAVRLEHLRLYINDGIGPEGFVCLVDALRAGAGERMVEFGMPQLANEEEVERCFGLLCDVIDAWLCPRLSKVLCLFHQAPQFRRLQRALYRQRRRLWNAL